MGEVLIDETTFKVPGALETNFKKLFEFLRNGTLCDVEIRAGNKAIKCHRNVLASCSPYFQAMFTTPLIESKQDVITIGDIDGSIMEMLIKFAYTAQVNIHSLNAQALLRASSVLQMDTLAQTCCDFMSAQLHISNCLGVRQLADQLGHKDLVVHADEFTKAHFREVSREAEYNFICPKHLEDIISSDDLFVDEEVEVYEAMMKWVKYDVEKRRSALPKLLSKIRLPLLPLEYLRMYVEPDSLVRKSLECRDLLDEARHYQMWHFSRLPNTHLPVNYRTRPRKSYSGVIFCVGGRGENGLPFASNEMYSWYHNKWFRLQDMCYKRRHVGAVCVKGKIYAVGGCSQDEHLSTSEVFHPLRNEWSLLASITVPRRGLGLCAMSGAIYAIGGLDNNKFYSIVERYDICSDVWTVVAPMNCARGGVAVVKLKGLIYALGGNSGSVSLQTCEVYDPHLDKWSYIESLHQCRAGAGAVVVDGYIYVIGGFENNEPISSVERFDPDHNRWHIMNSMKFGRGGVGAAAIGGHIFAIGGHNATDYLNTVEVYDIEKDRWEMGPNLRDYRAGAGVTWCPLTADRVREIVES